MKYLFTLLLCFHINAYPQLTGEVRTSFMSSMQKACYKTQRQGSPNTNASDNMLRQYCRCSSIYIADLLNEPLVRDIEAGKIKFNPTWNQLAADYCRINFSKY